MFPAGRERAGPALGPLSQVAFLGGGDDRVRPLWKGKSLRPVASVTDDSGDDSDYGMAHEHKILAANQAERLDEDSNYTLSACGPITVILRKLVVNLPENLKRRLRFKLGRPDPAVSVCLTCRAGV